MGIFLILFNCLYNPIFRGGFAVNVVIRQLFPRLWLRLRAWWSGVSRNSPGAWWNDCCQAVWKSGSEGVSVTGDNEAVTGRVPFLGWAIRSGNWTRIAVLKVDLISVLADQRIFLCFNGLDSGGKYRIIEPNSDGLFCVLLGPAKCDYRVFVGRAKEFHDRDIGVQVIQPYDLSELRLSISGETTISWLTSRKRSKQAIPPLY